MDQNAANTTFNINLDMPIFDGFKIPNDIAARKLDLQAAIESLNRAKEDLAVNIASYYLKVLYNKELQRVAQLQVDLDKEQVNKTEAMVNAGKVPLSQLYDIKAQLAKDEVTLTEATNNVQLALLDLAQSLELERSDRSFDIETPQIADAVAENMSSILPPETIFDQAVTFKPQIKEQEYLLESQKRMLKVAQAGYYPKLNFGASYSNGYYHTSMGGEYADTRSFGDQLKQKRAEDCRFLALYPAVQPLPGAQQRALGPYRDQQPTISRREQQEDALQRDPAGLLQRDGCPREIPSFG